MTKNKLFIAGFVAMLLLSCSQKEHKKEIDLVTFNLKGQVVAVDRAARRITISHEEITNYMMAMTMPFKVKDTTLFNGVEPGDSVRGILAVSHSESWLEGISVIGKGRPLKEMLAEDIAIQRFFQIGNPLPDVALRNEDDKVIRFSDFRGKVVLLTFIYTRCPLPDACIRMSENFLKIQQRIDKEPELRDKWHLISISFDPTHDTPSVLKAEGKKYHADFSNWDLVSGTKQTIAQLAEGFDLMLKTSQGGLINHYLRTALLDQNGKLVKIFKSNDWSAEEIVSEIHSLLKKQAS